MKNHRLACLFVLVSGVAHAQPGGDPGAPPPPAPAPSPPPPSGPAGLCVTIDPARDTLTEQERAAARSILLQTFEAEKLATDPNGVNCTETYALSNIKLGNTINVTIAGPRGQRTARATSLDDLPNVYSQIVRSLVTGQPIETGGAAVDRSNVTKEQSSPRRVAADNLKYFQLGYGMVNSGRVAYGPAFGAGYRKELDRIAIDISLTFLLGNDTELSDGVTMSIPKLLFLWNQDPKADATVYYGAGVSYGFAVVRNSETDTLYTGSGLQGHLTAGYVMFRSSTIRGFLQLDAVLPFYKSDGDRATDTRWPAGLMFSLGFGWGKTNVVRVINE